MKIVALLCPLLLAMPFSAPAQTDPAGVLDFKGKLRYEVTTTYSPLGLAGMAAYAGVLQGLNSPEEWGQGSAAYGKRVASMAGWSGIHTVLAVGLDSSLHQDPRYYRSVRKGFWRRTGHAFRETILTRTDSGHETLSTWRLGSAYGSAFLSNLWYPDRVDTVGLGFVQGTVTLGFGALGNLGTEFWPDIKHKVFRRKVSP